MNRFRLSYVPTPRINSWVILGYTISLQYILFPLRTQSTILIVGVSELNNQNRLNGLFNPL